MLIKSNFLLWVKTQNGCKVSDFLTTTQENER